MAKERLSKLQKTIMGVINDKKYNCYNDLDMIRHIVGNQIRICMSVSDSNCLSEKLLIDKRNFEVSFCNSIRNLKKKELVRFTWKSNTHKKSRIDKIFLTENGLKLIMVINNKKRSKK